MCRLLAAVIFINKTMGMETKPVGLGWGWECYFMSMSVFCRYYHDPLHYGYLCDIHAPRVNFPRLFGKHIYLYAFTFSTHCYEKCLLPVDIFIYTVCLIL